MELESETEETEETKVEWIYAPVLCVAADALTGCKLVLTGLVMTNIRHDDFIVTPVNSERNHLPADRK